ncbi:MAG TPA: cation diffusion facilitator family transporter [Acidimicrobiales bacterium]|nr:cation diffusion facilitator family transporter [Acidimicrobiales bacterium]
MAHPDAEHDHRDQHHAHPRGEPDQVHGARVRDRIRSIFVPHSHDTSESIASALASTAEGVRALKVSLAVLAVTAGVELAVVMWTGSVGLLSDTIHNFADALTAVPLGVAFWIGRRPINDRYTYGYGRAEDLAGICIVGVIAASSIVAAWEAVLRINHPRSINGVGWVAAAGLVGFAGNELVAGYRIRVGRRIGSAALVVDGRHARTDGFTSLAVVLGAIGVAAGWKLADPVVGLVITVAVLVVLRGAARDIYRRLMDSVDPELVEAVRRSLAAVEDVLAVDRVRIRWVGHELIAEVDLAVDASLSVSDAHTVAEHSEHQLLHDIPRLARATIHIDPWSGGASDAHRITAHHFPED